MSERVEGLHHVTAICGDPQRNLNFYAGVLGMRVVKQTVNYDDPRTYHFYYGDEYGSPGSLMTFFAWPSAAMRGGNGRGRGQAGNGQAVIVSFRVAAGVLWFWQQRLAAFGVEVGAPSRQFELQRLRFRDPDGIELELVADPDQTRDGYARPQIPAEYALRGLHGVRLAVDTAAYSAEFLVAQLGFSHCGAERGIMRFEPSQAGSKQYVELDERPAGRSGVNGVGTVHHAAFTCRDDAAQLELRRRLGDAGVGITGTRDRRYFRSIYFREPGSVLFEIATAGPGFVLDEPQDRLGEKLQLPPWLESRRAAITRELNPIQIPESFSPEVQV